VGWWRTADGDALGDGPADIVAEELEALNQALGRKARLDELLGALQLVLRAKANDLLAAGSAVPRGRLVADLDIADVRTRIETAPAVDETTRDRIDAMSARISQEYELAFERRPTLRELLASIQFVLGDRAESHLELPEDSAVRAIVVA
jgi:hypothetical protein